MVEPPVGLAHDADLEENVSGLLYIYCVGLDEMNRIVLIGNGFDMAHGMKTSYKQFLDWYWDRRINDMFSRFSDNSEDELCTISLSVSNVVNFWMRYESEKKSGNRPYGIELVEILKRNYGRSVSFTKTPFFEAINRCVEQKGWVDIENEYYNALKTIVIENSSNSVFSRNLVMELDKQLAKIQSLLIEYLSSMNLDCVEVNRNLVKKIHAAISENDISIESKRYQSLHMIGRKTLGPDHVMLLSFNYTGLAERYVDVTSGDECRYIHGRLENPEHVIFGYGDELEDGYEEIKKRNDNLFLRNMKSIRYMETDDYRKVLTYLESAPFQVYVMGHSCGNSDRTLLNTIFEHKNCVSIKPFYYKKLDGTDNYMEIVQNISRNFRDMKLMRDRVVNKMYCETLMD